MRERAVDMLDHALVAAHQVDDALNVVRHQRRILPRRAFAEAALVRIVGVERFDPCSVGAFAAHKAGFGIEDVFVVLGALGEEPVILLIAELARQLSGAPVVIGQLERHGDGKIMLAVRFVGGQIPQLAVRGGNAFGADIGARRRMLHRGKSRFIIKVAPALDIGFRQHAGGMVSGHAGHQPETGRGRHRQLSGLVVIFHQRLGDVVLPLRLDQLLERVRGAEGVPDRPDIAVKMAAVAVLRVRLTVGAEEIKTVLLVIFHGQVHAAVQIGIENALGRLVVGFNIDDRERLVPGVLAVGDDLVKVERGDLPVQIFGRLFHADIGDADFCEYGFSLCSLKHRHGADFFAVDFRDVFKNVLAFPEDDLLKGLGEPQREVDARLGRVRIADRIDAVAAQLAVAADFRMAVIAQSILAQRVGKVEQQTGIRRGRIGQAED